jgi:rhodanese-related sulfurtransferase
MKKLLVFFLFILLAWDFLWGLLGVKPLFPWQLQEIMTKDRLNLVLLDVRTPREFQWFHLPGAQHAPLATGLMNTLTIPRTKTVVVICMTGHRSPWVAYRLFKDGYPRVYNLTGGMAGWEVWKWLTAVRTDKSADPELKQAHF